MKYLPTIGLIAIASAGLSACGGGGGGGGAVNNKQEFILTPLATEDRPSILLKGAAVDPKDLPFSIEFKFYDNGNLKSNLPASIQTLDSINSQLLTWNDNATSLDDIAVSYQITSSNPNVVSFENGKLVAHTPGKTNLSITLDTTKPLNQVFDTSDIEFSGFQGTYDYGQVVVCPFNDIDLGLESKFARNIIEDQNSPIDVIGFQPDVNDVTNSIDTSIIAFAEINEDELIAAGLTQEDCQTSTFNGGDSFSNLINNSISTQNLIPSSGFKTQNGVRLLGFEFPKIKVSRITSVNNPEITSIGYGGNLVLNAINPFTVEAQSSELGRTIDISRLYLALEQPINDYTNALGIGLVDSSNGCPAALCIDSSRTNYTVQLNHPTLPTISTDERPIRTGVANMKLDKMSGSPGTTFSVLSTLTVEGEVYDTSSIFNIGGSGTDLTSAGIDSGSFHDYSAFANSFTIHRAFAGVLSQYTDNRIDLNFVTGDKTDESIRGRWVQADTGEDHFIAKHSNINYTTIDNQQITYQTSNNTTATLLKAGIPNVAVSGTVNIVEEVTGGSNFMAYTPNAKANGLSGIANIDLILENVNTGEDFEVNVDQDGNFNEEIPTGEYNVDGTLTDGVTQYTIDTQIIVENDATDTGKLNLAKVGLYNFDISVSGCEHNFQCYSGKNYSFTITAKNSGVIPASGIQAIIGNGAGGIDDVNIAASNIPATQIISGTAPGQSITYTFTASFNQPAEDTVVEVPITLKDAANRTWEDIVKIKLSKYDARVVTIYAYNAGATAKVRGYLMLDGRTPIRVDGSRSNITIPNQPGASFELILSNQEYNQETPYGVANNTNIVSSHFLGFSDLSRNENSDDTIAGAQEINDSERFISYISAGDVDHYLINIPTL